MVNYFFLFSSRFQNENETKNISELINSIVESYSQAEAARRKDNWVEYGKSKQQFEQLLQQLKKKTENKNYPRN